jgi:hypothetical protein
MDVNETVANLERDGFSLWPNFVADETCVRLRAQLEELPYGDIVRNEAGDFHGDHTALAPNIITRSSDFIDLAMEPRILEVADRYFSFGAFEGEKDCFQLHLMHARRVDQQASIQELHIDSRLCGVSPPLVLHLFLYLDDCLEEKAGATRVVPQTHRFQRYSTSADEAKAIPLIVRKGTLAFLNSNLFHGSSAKTTSGSRWLISIAYSRWWIRQPYAIPYFSGWPRALSQREKALFGFSNYADKNRSPRGMKSRGPLPLLVPPK